jgi:hypothetical protein
VAQRRHPSLAAAAPAPHLELLGDYMARRREWVWAAAMEDTDLKQKSRPTAALFSLWLGVTPQSE